MTLNELILFYWTKHVQTHYVKNSKPSSEQEIIRPTLRVVREHDGMPSAADFGPVKLKAVRKVMIDRGWCRESINQRVNRIRRRFKWAVSEELIDESTWQSLSSVTALQKGRTHAKESIPVLPVEEETINTTLPHLPRVVADMVRIQLLRGVSTRRSLLHSAVRH